MTCADDSATPTQLFSDTTFPTYAMKYWPGVAISAISESPSCEKRYRLWLGKSLLHRSSACASGSAFRMRLLRKRAPKSVPRSAQDICEAEAKLRAARKSNWAKRFAKLCGDFKARASVLRWYGWQPFFQRRR